MRQGRALVVAKAPVPGRVKTRLAGAIGSDSAAALASAALLDTLAVCSEAFDECHLALDGDLSAAVGGAELLAAACGWDVFPQASGTLGARLADAHERVSRAGAGPVVQLGMDTPQATPALLRSVASRAGRGTAVLGPALDGGWWVLGTTSPRAVHRLVDVPMSTSRTHDLTRRALAGAGLRVRRAPQLRDVDTVEDAVAVAGEAPHTRFAAAWRHCVEAA